MFTLFMKGNGGNCRQNAVLSKRGGSELWDWNVDSSCDDIGEENENYNETEDDNENIDQTSREYPSLRRHAQHLTKSFITTQNHLPFAHPADIS